MVTTMSFLILLTLLSLIAYAAGRLFKRRLPPRDAMRLGMGCAFLYTGLDHFMSGATRYVPMMPDLLENYAFELVWLTGGLEIAGAVGLLLPLRVYQRLGLPNLRGWAGVGLAVLLCVMVIANINVAVTGSHVAGLDFGPWYYWSRPFFQPVFVIWALYAAGVYKTSSLRENTL